MDQALMSALSGFLGGFGFSNIALSPMGIGAPLGAFVLFMSGKFGTDASKIMSMMSPTSPMAMQMASMVIQMVLMIKTIENQLPYAAVPITAAMAIAIIIPNVVNLISMLDSLGLLKDMPGGTNPIKLMLSPILISLQATVGTVSDLINGMKNAFVGPLEPLGKLLIPPVPSFTLPSL